MRLNENMPRRAFLSPESSGAPDDARVGPANLGRDPDAPERVPPFHCPAPVKAAAAPAASGALSDQTGATSSIGVRMPFKVCTPQSRKASGSSGRLAAK